MGSFNTTCAISKAPITPNQKVRVFFLVMDMHSYHYEKRSKGLFSLPQMGCQCYPWDTYKVIGYPALATYEDYNNYEFVDKDLEQLTLDAINEIYIPNTVQEGKKIEDYNEYHDYLNIDKISSMEELQNMEHSGALRVKSYHGTSILVKMAIIEDVFQKLIKPKKYNMDRNNYNKYYSIEEYIEKIYNKIKDNKSLMDSDDLNFNNLKKTIKEKTKDEKEYQEKLDMMLEFKMENIMSKIFEDPASYNRMIMSDNINKANSELKLKLIEAWATFQWTTRFMESYNLEYAPTITSGQCYDFKRHGKMLEELSEVISNMRDPYDEETVSLKTEKITKLSMSLKELNDKMRDWFSPQDKIYQDYLNVKKLMEENDVSYVDLEEDNEISKFFIDNEIIEVSKGIIYLEE